MSNFSREMKRRDVHLQIYPPPPAFAVVSWGCTGTAWLAGVLNSHPDIFCLHAGNHSMSIFGNCPLFDGKEYVEVLRNLAHGHLLAGDVHGISRHTIPAIREELGAQFECAILVRDPLPRLKSQLSLSERFAHTQVWDISYTDVLIERESVQLPDQSYASKLFVHNVNMLNAIIEEQAVGKVFRCEDLWTSPDMLKSLVDHVSHGIVEASDAWASNAIKRNKVNEHRTAEIEFVEWQHEAIKKIVLPTAWEQYESLGYARPVC